MMVVVRAALGSSSSRGGCGGGGSRRARRGANAGETSTGRRDAGERAVRRGRGALGGGSASGRFDARASGSSTSEEAVRGGDYAVEEGVAMRLSMGDARGTAKTKETAGEKKKRGNAVRRREGFVNRGIEMRDVRCVVLAGGADETNPLTRARARSAVHLGGTYRVIDFPMTNLVNSGLRQMYVLTQYNSHSLVSHVNRAFPSVEMFGNNNAGFIEVLPTTQTREHGETWSIGSADCVARHLSQGSLTKQSYEMRLEDACLQANGSLEECAADQLDGVTIVLAAEQLYTMDFEALLEQHLATEADVTVATCDNVSPESASSLGILDVDKTDARVLSFIEKPSDNQLVEFMQCTTEELEDCKLNANMGVYVFNNSVLDALLKESKAATNDERHEFGRDVIPYAVQHGCDVFAFKHHGYWMPLRSLRDIYEANISAATGGEAASLLDFSRPVYTKPNFLPPTTFYGSSLTEGSIISDGCVVNDGAKIVDSVIGPCTVIAKNVELDGTVIVGRDEIMKRTQAEQDIGKGTVIRRCIVDSDAMIGANVRILNEAGVQNIDRSEDGYVISDGIVTILGGATIPDGFII